MEVELECYLCHEKFIVKDFNGGISVLETLHCPKCLKERVFLKEHNHG